MRKNQRMFWLFIVGMCSVLHAKVTVLDKAPDWSAKDTKLVFVSVASYVEDPQKFQKPWMLSTKTGYRQSLPRFFERFIGTGRDQLSQMRIVLIDPSWSEDLYERSDLKRYLSTRGDIGKKIEDQLYLVGAKFSYDGKTSQPAWLLEKLTQVLKAKGIVFLVDNDRKFTGDQLPNLYNHLWDLGSGTVQYLSAIDYGATSYFWAGNATCNTYLQAILYYRRASPAKTKDAFYEGRYEVERLKKALGGTLPVPYSIGGDTAIREIFEKVKLDERIEWRVREEGKVHTKKAFLDMDFFVKGILPCMYVSSTDDVEADPPRLFYGLCIDEQGDWTLFINQNPEIYWERYRENK